MTLGTLSLHFLAFLRQRRSALSVRASVCVFFDDVKWVQDAQFQAAEDFISPPLVTARRDGSDSTTPRAAHLFRRTSAQRLQVRKFDFKRLGGVVRGHCLFHSGEQLTRQVLHNVPVKLYRSTQIQSDSTHIREPSLVEL
ncbi:hypothetical protein MRX96_012783 [Rhipicephalus microplus]